MLIQWLFLEVASVALLRLLVCPLYGLLCSDTPGVVRSLLCDGLPLGCVWLFSWLFCSVLCCCLILLDCVSVSVLFMGFCVAVWRGVCVRARLFYGCCCGLLVCCFVAV